MYFMNPIKYCSFFQVVEIMSTAIGELVQGIYYENSNLAKVSV